MPKVLIDLGRIGGEEWRKEGQEEKSGERKDRRGKVEKRRIGGEKKDRRRKVEKRRIGGEKKDRRERVEGRKED